MSGIRIDQVTPRVDRFKPVLEVPEPPKEKGLSFGEVIKGIVGDAVEADQEASKAIEDFAAGNINDVHDVVLAVGKANMAIQLLVQIRNGVLEAYGELSKISM